MKHRGHREGHVYQRSDGRWEWKITMPNGDRRSFYGKTKREATEKKNRALRDAEEGLSQNRERMTVNQYLDEWLEVTAKERVRPSTLRSYTSHVNTHLKPTLKGIRLRELQPDDVNRLLAAIVNKGTSPTTANRVRATLRTALSSAVKSRYVSINAAGLSEPRKERRTRVDPLEVKQAKQLIDATRKDLIGPLIEFAVYTGMRQGELLALRWQDVDLENGIATIHRTLTWQKNETGEGAKNVPVFSDPKTEQSRRSIRLPEAAINALERQREKVIELEQKATVSRWRPIPGEDLIFVSSVGTPLNGPNVTNRLQRLLEAMKLPKQRFHDLRHLTASLLLAEGLDIFAVKEILGHSQISQTANTYGHLTQRLSDHAASRLDLALSDDRLTTKLTTDTIASGITIGGEDDE